MRNFEKYLSHSTRHHAITSTYLINTHDQHAKLSAIIALLL